MRALRQRCIGFERNDAGIKLTNLSQKGIESMDGAIVHPIRVWQHLRLEYPTQMSSRLNEIHAQKSSHSFHICFSLLIRILCLVNLLSAT